MFVKACRITAHLLLAILILVGLTAEAKTCLTRTGTLAWKHREGLFRRVVSISGGDAVWNEYDKDHHLAGSFVECGCRLHGKLRYPVGHGSITLGENLLPLLPSNDIFYQPAKLRSRLDEDGYLYFKRIIPREVADAALEDLAVQMRACAWTLDADRQRQVDLHGFTMGIPFPSNIHDDSSALPPPALTYTDPIRNAVSGSSTMAVVRQVFGGAVHPVDLQTLHLGAPGEACGLRMPSVFANRGTKLAVVALAPLHDIPMHCGAPVLVRGSNGGEGYAAIRQTYGQWEVESGNIGGDGSFTMEPMELSPLGKQAAHDTVTGAPIITDVHPFMSCSFEAGDLLLMTVYTMHAFLTNQSSNWRVMAEAIWTMEGDDVGPDPRYVGSSAAGLQEWLQHRDDPAKYPRTMQQAKREWGLIPKAPSPDSDDAPQKS